LPLDPGNVVCAGGADEPDDYDEYLAHGGYDNICLSCNSNKSLENRIAAKGLCQANDALKCGKDSIKCRPGQFCFGGKCVCIPGFISNFLAWNPFIDQDPDRDNKADASSKPASGCASLLVTSSVLGFVDRSLQTLFRFTDCIKLSQGNNVTEITPKDFKNATFRAIVCPGGTGKCPASFCDELHRNFTGSDRNSLCGAVSSSADQLKRCAQNMILSGETSGDLECANTQMRDIVASGRQTLSGIDLFNFLGCDGDKDDFIYKLNLAERGLSFPYRAQTAQKLLGAASHASMSVLVALVLLIVSLFNVYQ